MSDDPADGQVREFKPHYRWPWFVLGAVVLGIVLAIIWMSREVERTRRNRDQNSATPQNVR